MQQIILGRPGQFTCQQTPEPAATADHALVSVRRIGVCGTDLHAFAGRQPYISYPRILGHELGVEVITAPPNDRNIKPADRCTVEPGISCGHCHACSIGKTNCCENLKILGVHVDGGMREIFAVSVGCLHRSEKLSLDQLALIEPLSIGAHAVTRSGLLADQTALVVGAGPIGLATIRFAQVTGAHLRVLEVNEQRRQWVKKEFNLETLAEPDRHLYEVVFDATGSPLAMQASFQFVAHGGTLVFVGLVDVSIPVDDPLFHRREMTLLASRNSINQFPRIIDLIERGEIDTSPWITHRMALANVPANFPELPEKVGLVKAVIDV